MPTEMLPLFASAAQGLKVHSSSSQMRLRGCSQRAHGAGAAHWGSCAHRFWLDAFATVTRVWSPSPHNSKQTVVVHGIIMHLRPPSFTGRNSHWCTYARTVGLHAQPVAQHTAQRWNTVEVFNGTSCTNAACARASVIALRL